nr:zinc finger, CCHC-type [Tanacetum cinerariifolium]
MPEHLSDTLSIHSDDENPSRAIIKQALRYREENNEDAFAVPAVEKIYAHESLNFNYIVACEVISNWKAGLKEDMYALSDVYVLNNDCKKCSDDNDAYYSEYTLAMKEAIWLKQLLAESEAELKLVAVVTTGTLIKVALGPRFQHSMKEAIWLKQLLAKSEAELKLVAVVTTGTLIKAPMYEDYKSTNLAVMELHLFVLVMDEDDKISKLALMDH